MQVCLQTWLVNAYGQGTESLHDSWTYAHRVESIGSARVARFTGIVEGSYRIKVPRVWQLDNAKPTNGTVEKELGHDKPRVICKESLGHETTCTVTEGSSPSGVVVDLFRKDNKLEWQSEIENLFPRVAFQGAGRIHGDVVSTEERLFFIGRCGGIRFIVVMRLTDGKLIDHFAFAENSIENLAVIGKYNQK